MKAKRLPGFKNLTVRIPDAERFLSCENLPGLSDADSLWKRFQKT